MITATEPKCIAEHRERLEKQLSDLEAVVSHAAVAEEVFSDIPRRIEIGDASNLRVWLYLDDYRDVVPYLHELALRGYRAQKNDTYYEDEDKTCRCYTRREIAVWVHLTGRKCHRVQVGTKEVPVYEIQCGEEATA